jgi:hypothetical protein
VDERVWIGRVGVVVGWGEGGVVMVVGETEGSGAATAGVRRVARAVGGGVGGAFSSSAVTVRVRFEAAGMVLVVLGAGVEG